MLYNFLLILTKYLFIMLFKLALILSVEMLVLIAAIFLLVYITKQQVSKWFTYGTSAILIALLAMMVCTMCCTMCMHHRKGMQMNRECVIRTEGCENGMMESGMRPPCPPPMMMHGGNCCKEKEKGECEHRNNCESNEECDMHEKGMHKMMKVTIEDSMPKKEIMIKKK